MKERVVMVAESDVVWHHDVILTVNKETSPREEN